MKTEERVKLLRTVLTQQSESGKTKVFRKWIAAWISMNVPGCKMLVHDGNLYVSKGNADYFPCIVSHTDTVHDIDLSVTVHRSTDFFFAWSSAKQKQYGIGGDDKVGVWMCLLALAVLPAVKCAFFRVV